MATKMTDGATPDDYFLSELIKHSVPEKAPSDLQKSIMQQILTSKKNKNYSVFNLPQWIKWGVPSIALICSLIVLFWPRSESTTSQIPDFLVFQNLGHKTDTWFASLFNAVELPELSLPDYAVWLCMGAVVLFWAFVALNHFLGKRFTH
jgi:hypothetical protein